MPGPLHNPAILVAHPAYQVKTVLDAAHPGLNVTEARTADAFAAAIPEAEVVIVSGLWRNTLLDRAPRLRFIQSISAGVNQYDQVALAARGIRLASAQGANARAVAQHAMALILALARRLPDARDNQLARHWRPMQGDFARREDELTGQTLLIVGLGGIGGRLAHLARAFEMHVIGVRQDPARGLNGADSVHAFGDLDSLWPQADVIALTCPLTPQTERLIGPAALARMKPGARLVNVARGACVDEPALIAALQSGRLDAAALDVTAAEPLPPDSPLWTLPNVFVTSHLGGETRRYEANLVEILLDNLARLGRGETALRNQIV